MAEAALNEKAVEELRELQGEIDEHLGTQSSPFNPQRVVTDPGRLVSSVKRYQRLIRMRDRMQARYRVLLRLPTPFLIGLVLAIVGLIAVVAVLIGIFNLETLLRGGAWVTAAGLVDLAITFVVYGYLERRLSDAMILSSPMGSND